MILKDKIKSRQFLLATHINGADPSFTELLGSLGFDFLWIDTEHTSIDYDLLKLHLIAARASCCPSVVRIPWNDQILSKRVLELGPEGIIIPMIRNEEEAFRAIAATRYPPNGIRSFGPIRASSYGLLHTDEYFDFMENSFCRFLQIEHKDAVENIEKIVKVDGIDALILGPCDLAASYGYIGHPEAKVCQDAIDYVISICKSNNVSVGASMGTVSFEGVCMWKKRGVNFISSDSEYSFIAKSAKEYLSFSASNNNGNI